ncbi:hypothetical protein BF49_2535 [Bradyrhizobium sp.]|uniref:hypothetical protein n=1 Tax=Bradyrhizobium sp. TaxID=376 RepID=UPI0007C19E3B|nr:hypothetical protein [Bradyrhizobium sp.]CUT11455.1 hypothetical protein BF49_2535 [Bradyrhizobium sp.]
MRYHFTEAATGETIVDGNVYALEAALAARGMTIEDLVDAAADGQIAGSVTGRGGAFIIWYPRPAVDRNLDMYIDAVQQRIAVDRKARGLPDRDLPGTIEARDYLEKLHGDGVPVHEAAVLTADEFL